MTARNSQDPASATALDMTVELCFSDSLLKKIYKENRMKKLMNAGEVRAFRLSVVQDYVDMGFTPALLSEDRDDCLAAQRFFESVGQRLLAQRAAIRAQVAGTLMVETSVTSTSTGISVPLDGVDTSQITNH